MASGPSASAARAALPKLVRALDARQPEVALCGRYRDGDHRLRLATAKFKAAFGEAFETSSNWCPLIVEASVERLAVTGFRFGPDEDADKDAWRMWQANGLDAESVQLHDEAVSAGSAYILVAPPDDGDQSVITVESPEQCIVLTAPGRRQRRVAGLKRWRESNRTMATVYLPDGAYKFQSAHETQAGGIIIGQYAVDAWEPRDGVDFYAPHDADAVQLIEVRNQPRLGKPGRSDFRGVIPLIDAANKLLCDLLVASEFYAYPQRVLTGIEVPLDDDGSPLDIDLKAALTRVLTFADDVGVHSFQPGDLENYTKSMRELQLQIAAQTRIPAHYMLTGNSVAPSGESIKSVEAGIVKRVRRKMLDFSDPWEEAMRLAFRMKGDLDRGRAMDAETIWADPETRTEAEHVDATLKLRGLLSDETLMERLGMSPTEIQRELARKEAEALRSGIADLFTGAANEQGVGGAPFQGGGQNGTGVPAGLAA